MENLWAPWRMEYIKKVDVDKEGCIFCQKPAEDKDAENYIVHREKFNFVILNLYPYNPGHLMVVPFRHLATPEDLTSEEMLEHYELVRKCISALKKASNPDGFNVGMNLGRVAAAASINIFILISYRAGTATTILCRCFPISGWSTNRLGQPIRSWGCF